MDKTALQLTEILADYPDEYVPNSFLKDVCHQFSSEVMAKNIIGDSNANVLEQKGELDSYKAICAISNGIYWRTNNVLSIILIYAIPFGIRIGKLHMLSQMLKGLFSKVLD